MTEFLKERAKRNGETYKRTARAASGLVTTVYAFGIGMAIYNGRSQLIVFSLLLVFGLVFSPLYRHASWFTAWAGYYLDPLPRRLKVRVLECGHCTHVEYDVKPFVGPSGWLGVEAPDETRWYCSVDCMKSEEGDG